jgi:hypothetical protein
MRNYLIALTVSAVTAAAGGYALGGPALAAALASVAGAVFSLVSAVLTVLAARS